MGGGRGHTLRISRGKGTDIQRSRETLDVFEKERTRVQNVLRMMASFEMKKRANISATSFPSPICVGERGGIVVRIDKTAAGESPGII